MTEPQMASGMARYRDYAAIRTKQRSAALHAARMGDAATVVLPEAICPPVRGPRVRRPEGIRGSQGHGTGQRGGGSDSHGKTRIHLRSARRGVTSL